MTKKSTARKTRDEYKKSNTAWDDLNGIYFETNKLLNTVRTQVNDFFEIEGVSDFVPMSEKSKASAALQSFHADIGVFDGDLVKIHNGHAGKSGPLQPDESIMSVIELSEAYINYQTRFDAIVTPTYTYLLSVMQMVEKNASAVEQAGIAKKAAELDVQIVTDVEAKPVAVAAPV